MKNKTLIKKFKDWHNRIVFLLKTEFIKNLEKSFLFFYKKLLKKRMMNYKKAKENMNYSSKNFKELKKIKIQQTKYNPAIDS